MSKQYTYEIVRIDNRANGGVIEFQGVIYDATDRVVYRSPICDTRSDVERTTLTVSNKLPGAEPYTCRKRAC